MFIVECSGCGQDVELEESERRKRRRDILCYSCREILKRERKARREHEWEKYIEDTGE